MTKRELEMEVRRQQFYAGEARQKAYDTSFAPNLLLNDSVTPFHTATHLMAPDMILHWES
jgi:hypothetical protein